MCSDAKKCAGAECSPLQTCRLDVFVGGWLMICDSDGPQTKPTRRSGASWAGADTAWKDGSNVFIGNLGIGLQGPEPADQICDQAGSATVWQPPAPTVFQINIQ